LNLDDYIYYLSLLSIESDSNMESIQQSHINTVNELNQQLFDMKGAYEQLDAEKQFLSIQLEKLSNQIGLNQVKQTTGRFLSFYTEK
jgi:TolA-binding protein